MIRRPPRSPLSPYTTLFRSLQARRDRRGHLVDIGANGAQAAHPESWQLYEIDRVSDPAQIERLQRDLEVTLADVRSEEHTSELQSQSNLVCRLLLEKKNPKY